MILSVAWVKTSMEATLSQADNIPLIGELALNLQRHPRAPYVVSRNQVTSYCPQNVLTHVGTNVMQFTIASSDQWLDPKSVVLAFDIQNTGGTPLELLSTDMQVLFSRLQVMMGSVIVEDHTQHFNRLTTLLNKYQSTDKILETSALALGTPQAMTAGGGGAVTPQLFTVEDIKPEKIPAGEKRRVCMRLTTSTVFASSDSWIPLFALNGGVRLQLTLDAAENVVKRNDANGQANQSTQFELSAAVCLWDAITLDSQLQNKYFEQLASGGTLLWEGSQFSTSEVFLPVNTEGTFSASVSKPVSRLNTIFNTFVPRLDPADKAAGRQVCNTFRGYGESAYSRDNLSLQVQLGSTEYPQRPVRGYSEAYMRLLRALGILSSQAHSIAVSKKDFSTNSFCLASDTKQVSTVQSSGQNVQGVETRISGSFLADGQGQANSGVDRVFFHMHYQVFIEIRAGSVTLLT